MLPVPTAVAPPPLPSTAATPLWPSVTVALPTDEAVAAVTDQVADETGKVVSAIEVAAGVLFSQGKSR